MTVTLQPPQAVVHYCPAGTSLVSSLLMRFYCNCFITDVWFILKMEMEALGDFNLQIYPLTL